MTIEIFVLFCKSDNRDFNAIGDHSTRANQKICLKKYGDKDGVHLLCLSQ
jgi:hypothetical protein